MRHMYKVCREYGRRMASYRGEIAVDHPNFAVGSAAAIPEAPVQSIGVEAPDIVYTAEDDEVLEEYIRSTGGSAPRWISNGS